MKNTKRKAKKQIKWAQLLPIERVYLKMRRAEGYNNRYLEKRSRELESLRDKRERNRYYQLLCHWCKLKIATDAKSP